MMVDEKLDGPGDLRKALLEGEAVHGQRVSPGSRTTSMLH